MNFQWLLRGDLETFHNWQSNCPILQDHLNEVTHIDEYFMGDNMVTSVSVTVDITSDIDTEIWLMTNQMIDCPVDSFNTCGQPQSGSLEN